MSVLDRLDDSLKAEIVAEVGQIVRQKLGATMQITLFVWDESQPPRVDFRICSSIHHNRLGTLVKGIAAKWDGWVAQQFKPN